jgi:hypothetical protein
MTYTPSPARSADRWFTVLDGARLRQLRRQHGLSAAELAGKAGVGLSTVIRLDLLTELVGEFPQFSGRVAGSGGTFCGHDLRWRSGAGSGGAGGGPVGPAGGHG